ncbi:MAG: hypothetical protein U0R78_15460 [Nocardioidaceae bacterium]
MTRSPPRPGAAAIAGGGADARHRAERGHRPDLHAPRDPTGDRLVHRTVSGSRSGTTKRRCCRRGTPTMGGLVIVVVKTAVPPRHRRPVAAPVRARGCSCCSSPGAAPSASSTTTSRSIASTTRGCRWSQDGRPDRRCSRLRHPGHDAGIRRRERDRAHLAGPHLGDLAWAQGHGRCRSSSW